MTERRRDHHIQVSNSKDVAGWRYLEVDGKMVGRVAHRQQFRSTYVYQVELHNGKKASYFTMRDLKQRVVDLL